jgi:hypothetical protein
MIPDQLHPWLAPPSRPVPTGKSAKYFSFIVLCRRDRAVYSAVEPKRVVSVPAPVFLNEFLCHRTSKIGSVPQRMKNNN